MALTRFAGFSPALPPPCGGPAAVSWDAPIPTSRTLSEESLIDIVRALPQYRFEADVSHDAAKIALRVAIAERKRDRARVESLRLFHQSRESRPPSLDPAGIVADVECSWAKTSHRSQIE